MSGTVAAGERGLDLLARERPRVEAAIERILAGKGSRLDRRLAGPIRYALEAGGKRLRPILCVSAYRACGGTDTSNALYDAAVSIELIHTYSLMHDDLPGMDDDDLRRGRPTTHRVHGVAAATLGGALMIPLAVAALDDGATRLGLGSDARAAAIGTLTRAAGAEGMVGGQVLDLAAERAAVTAGMLESIHSKKTGALFAASLEIGGHLARAARPAIAALGRCGAVTGLAFQITDDVLDVTGQSSVLGKSAGRDREHGKATYPALMGIDAARKRARSAVRTAIAALRGAGIHDAGLESLIEFAVSRDR